MISGPVSNFHPINPSGLLCLGGLLGNTLDFWLFTQFLWEIKCCLISKFYIKANNILWISQLKICIKYRHIMHIHKWKMKQLPKVFCLNNLFSDVKSGSQSLNMDDNDLSVEGKQIICLKSWSKFYFISSASDSDLMQTLI